MTVTVTDGDGDRGDGLVDACATLLYRDAVSSSRESESGPSQPEADRERERPGARSVADVLLDVATILGVALLAHALVDLVEYTSFVLSAMPR